MKNISVIGIGYVGAVSAACLAEDGNHVIAVDIDSPRVECIRSGRSPIVEAGLDELIASNVAAGRLEATDDIAAAIASTDATLVCVGTPSAPDGSLGTTYIEDTCRQIGKAIAAKDSFHIVVIRSTTIPGTTENLCIPILEEASGKKAGIDFGVGYYPEFLRESTAIQDYHAPGLIVFGVSDEKTGEFLTALNEKMPVPCNVVSLNTAECVKYANNAWRATKVTFANEIGNIAKACGIDGQVVMDLITKDTIVNISPLFMRPGFAFGGSCLPKDLRALRHLGDKVGVETHLVDAMLEANEKQIQIAEDMVVRSGAKSAGLVGISFKPGTDDLRESPMAELANRLLAKGYPVKVYDPNVSAAYARKDGGYRGDISVKGLSGMLVASIDDLIGGSDIVVVGNMYAEARAPLVAASDTVPMIDLARIDKSKRTGAGYEGVCW